MDDFIKNEEAQTIGEMLRNARIRQNITLDVASRELCIRKHYLNAIENMLITDIPPMPYGLGFVRSYARYLGLNSDRIVASYRQILTGEEEPEPLHENEKQNGSSPHLKHILIGLAGLAVIAAAWSVFPESTRFEEIPAAKEDDFPKPVIVDEEEEKTESAGTVSEDENTAEQPEDPAAEESADTVDKDTGDEEVNTATKAEKAENAGTEEKTAVTSAPAMKVMLTGSSWLELRKDGKKILSGIYQKGFEYEIPAGKGYVITVGVPRNARFFLNGKQVSIATEARRSKINLDAYLGKEAVNE